jgi:folate-binding protein YgfZ
MSAKTDNEPTVLRWSVIEARGSDARSFLQGQLSQDLESIGPEGAWTLVLAPDSVVIAVGRIHVHDDGLDLVVPRELADVTHARLRRFLLRSHCTLEVRDIEDGPFASLAEQIELNWPGPHEIERNLTPHSFGRSFVDATISFTKGCFTGQELVGRLDARGSSVPWRLVRVEGASAPSIEEFLRSKGPEGPQGLTSALERDGCVVGLGVAHRTLLASERPTGIVVEELI